LYLSKFPFLKNGDLWHPGDLYILNETYADRENNKRARDGGISRKSWNFDSMYCYVKKDVVIDHDFMVSSSERCYGHFLIKKITLVEKKL